MKITLHDTLLDCMTHIALQADDSNASIPLRVCVWLARSVVKFFQFCIWIIILTKNHIVTSTKIGYARFVTQNSPMMKLHRKHHRRVRTPFSHGIPAVKAPTQVSKP